jgi:hypothetical protein
MKGRVKKRHATPPPSPSPLKGEGIRLMNGFSVNFKPISFLKIKKPRRHITQDCCLLSSLRGFEFLF